MFARITRLRHWKSEHTEQTCEDASQEDPARGLFAVADGAGTTLFSGIWATILAQHFTKIPLLTDNPFEVEWWVRLAQEEYRQKRPDPSKLPYNAQQKELGQGSESTLATL